MKHQKTKGYTLMEVIVYMFIATLMLTIITGIFYSMSRSYSHAAASYDVQREVYVAAEQIRRDISQTSLNSIVVYHHEGNNHPGVSMISAYHDEKIKACVYKRYFKMSDYGTPDWSEHIFYGVIPREPMRQEVGTPFQGKVGDLVRWNLSFDKRDNPLYPFPSEVLPSQYKTKKRPVKVLLRGIPLANAPGIKGMEHFSTDSEDYGGFQVAFIQQEKDDDGKVKKETLSSTNPTKLKSKKDTDKTSEMVQVNITNIYVSERTGNLSAYSFSFSVFPRN